MNAFDDNDDVRALLEAARCGDEQALGCLLAPHWCGLKLFCGLMLGDTDAAHQAMTETVLTARSEIDFVDCPASVRMWIHRIAAGVCLRAVDHGRVQNDQGSR